MDELWSFLLREKISILQSLLVVILVCLGQILIRDSCWNPYAGAYKSQQLQICTWHELGDKVEIDPPQRLSGLVGTSPLPALVCPSNKTKCPVSPWKMLVHIPSAPSFIAAT